MDKTLENKVHVLNNTCEEADYGILDPSGKLTATYSKLHAHT